MRSGGSPLTWASSPAGVYAFSSVPSTSGSVSATSDLSGEQPQSPQ